MKFFKPNPEYLAYVYSLDNNIVNTKNTIGIAIRLNEMIYYLPIDSANDLYYEITIFENRILDHKQIDIYSPNNTFDGMLKKTWFVGEDGKRYMQRVI